MKFSSGSEHTSRRGCVLVDEAKVVLNRRCRSFQTRLFAGENIIFFFFFFCNETNL